MDQFGIEAVAKDAGIIHLDGNYRILGHIVVINKAAWPKIRYKLDKGDQMMSIMYV